MLRDDIMAAARARAHMRYRLDPPPDGVTTTDCSLLVVDSARDGGAPLPPGVRTAEQIRQACVSIENDDVLLADLIFFAGTYDAAGPAGPDGLIASHVGFSLGRGTGLMLDAHERDGDDVATTNIRTPYWSEKIIGFGRLPALAAGNNPPPRASTLRGIDVASYQGNPDWAAVAASGIAFAFTKATEGDDYLNPTFARNWLEIPRAGLVRGAYHYARPEYGNAARSEADYFLANVLRMGDLAEGDLLALDLEPTSKVEDLAGWAIVWLDRVRERTGVTPIVYTGAWVAAMQGLATSSALGKHPLWLAAYQQAQPPAPAPWKTVTFWQHGDKGAVPGIAGNVDLNVFNGSAADLRRLGKGGQAPVAAPDQPPAHSYVLGFAELANRLGREVVGEPVEDEHDAERAGHPIRHQLTEKGEMVYYKESNAARFYPAA